MTRTNVRLALRHGATMLGESSREPRRDAAALLCRALGKDRTWLLANPEQRLSTAESWQYEQFLTRRAAHEPMQYILGEREFYGLRFEVTRDVLIPRPETEHLVEAALDRLPVDRHSQVADVGTGSGAIAVALAYQRPLIEVVALDLSARALAVAERNAAAHGAAERVRFLKSDLLAAVAGQGFDMIVSNPPYVAEAEPLEAQVRDWEPHGALFAGPDGLAIYRRLIPQAHGALVPGGWLLLEIGQGQRDDVASLLAGWQEVSFVKDLQRIPRVAVAQRASR